MFDKIKAMVLCILVSAATLLSPAAVKCLNNFTAADLVQLRADIGGPALNGNLQQNRHTYNTLIFTTWLGNGAGVSQQTVGTIRAHVSGAYHAGYAAARDQLLAISICNKCAWNRVNIVPLFFGNDNASNTVVTAIGNLTPVEQNFVNRFRTRYFGHIAKHFASSNLLQQSAGGAGVGAAINLADLIPNAEMNITLDPAAPLGAQAHSFCVYAGVNGDTFDEAIDIAKQVTQNFINHEQANMQLTVNADGITISINGAPNFVSQHLPDRLDYINPPNPSVAAQKFVANYNGAITKAAMIQNAALVALVGGNVNIFFKLWIPVTQSVNGPEQLGSFYVRN